MPESPIYQEIRRKLLPRNPYFQADVEAARRRLGIPPLGFEAALAELGERVQSDPSGSPIEKPDVDLLLRTAGELGLPLDEVFAGLRVQYRRRDRDFDQAIQENGWAVLPIFYARDWLDRWYATERKKAGTQATPPWTGLSVGVMEALISLLPPEVGALLRRSVPPPVDVRLPIGQEAMALARRYCLGNDYAPSVESLLVGEMGWQAQSEADFIYTPRLDGSGMVFIIGRLPYDLTTAEWTRWFQNYIQPALLEASGRVSRAVPFTEGLKVARRKARPGRPAYSPEVLEDHWRMWEFCHQESYLTKHRWAAASKAFHESLSEDEQLQFEDMGTDTFRKAVQGIESLLRPTEESQADF